MLYDHHLLLPFVSQSHHRNAQNRPDSIAWPPVTLVYSHFQTVTHTWTIRKTTGSFNLQQPVGYTLSLQYGADTCLLTCY